MSNPKICRIDRCGIVRGTVERLSLSEATLNAIIENAAITIYSLDRDFRYIHFNSYMKDSLKRVYGIDVRVGDVIFDFLRKISLQEVQWWHDIYVLALEGQTMEFVKEFVVGEYHSFLKFNVSPIREGNEITGLSCVAIDVTKERLAEKQISKMAEDLYRRNQDLEQYSYIIAHNLRAPIANLLGIANLLEMPSVSIADKEEAKSHILNSARRLDEVIKDLSNILESKEEMNEHRESVRFGALVDEVAESINHVIEKSGAMIITDFSKLERIVTIKTYLHSIFYNLITNSIKYSRPDVIPIITIKSNSVNGRTCLTFEDNGLGLDLNTHGSKVFGLYKRFHPEIAEGKGMGLFMVKTQVEALGGEIFIKSEVEKGMLITILI